MSILLKHTAAFAPEVGAGSGTDLGSGSLSFSDAARLYNEDAAPQNLTDNDDEDQGDPGQSGQNVDDGSQRQPQEKQDAEDQDDLDRLLADLDPEAGSSEGESDEGQGDPNAPQFVTEDQMVRLSDGTTKKVGDLMRDATEIQTQRAEFQQERQRFDEARGQVRQQYEAVQGQMQMLAQIAQSLMPQEPSLEMMQTDLYGYNILRAAYEKQVSMINQIVGTHQQNQQLLTQQQQESLSSFRQEQAQKLVQRDPRFGEDAFWGQFQKDLFSYGPRVYGYTADELREGMIDHRQFEVIRDAIEYQKIKAAVKARKGVKQHQEPRQRGAQMQQPRDPVTQQFTRQPQGRVVTGSAPRGRVSQQDAAYQAAKARFDKAPTLRNAIDLVD